MKIKKIVALMLALAMVVSGLYLVTPDTSEVKAADTTQSSSDALEPNQVEDGMLNVKMQIQQNENHEKFEDGTVNLRLVSSVNGLGYRNVGFEVYLDLNNDGDFADTDESTKFTTGDVSKRIDASKTGVTYNYSPKVIDTDAEYFVTGTLMGINAEYLSHTMCVKAFCTTIAGDKEYGTARYFNIEDATTENIINIPVQMSAAPTEEDVVTINGIETEATLVKYDGTYAHLNVTVPNNWANKTALPSASKIVVGSDENAPSAIYRNLLSDYTGTPDTSWYTVYEGTNEKEFVIATDADLYGFAALASQSSQTFAEETIYVVSNIDANDGTASATTFTPDEGASLYPWTSIKNFAGTFDGQMHTISGIYFQKEALAGAWGLFRETGECTVQNLILANSYMGLNTDQNVQFGSIAGKSSGKFDTIKIAEDVYLNYGNTNGTTNGTSCTGGIVGYMTGTSNDKGIVENCWFDGQITAGNYVGGILGNVQDGTDATTVVANHKKAIEMTNCLNSGTMVVNKNNPYFGGLCGQVTYAQLIINDSVNVSTVDPNDFTIISNNMGSGVSYISWNSNADSDMEIVTQNNRYTVTMNNTYLIRSDQWYRMVNKSSKGSVLIEGTPYTAGGVITGLTNHLYSDSLIGGTGYCNMNLDFSIKDVYEGVWTVTKENTPVLSSFVSDEEILDLDEVTTPRTLWYTKAAEGTQEYILYSTADMRGFASLVNDGTDFSDKTVKLGADITMNKGQATADGFKPEADGTEPFKWTPIKIEGTFDGDGHTISGVCVDAVNGDGSVGLFTTVSGTVRDFRLLNSYFSHADTTTAATYDIPVFTAPIGSVAGTLSGTVDTVYSDAIVKHEGAYAGGLVGVITSTGTDNTITNCCYAGSVSAHSGVGGILGLVANTSATITHCLNTGTVSGAHSSGGLCGYVWNYVANNTTYVLTLTDSLALGKYSNTYKSTDGSTNNFYGGAIGYLRNASGQVYNGAVTDTTYVMGWDSEGNNTWKRFAWESNNGRVKVDGVPISPNSVEVNFWTIQAILKRENLEGKMNLSFLPKGQASSATDTYYWVDIDGKIPMLESFEDLLTDVTF